MIDPRATQAGLALTSAPGAPRPFTPPATPGVPFGQQPWFANLANQAPNPFGGGQGGGLPSHPLMPGLGLINQGQQALQNHPLLGLLGAGGGGDKGSGTISGLPQGTFGQPAGPTGEPMPPAATGPAGSQKSLALMQLAQQFLGPALSGQGRGGAIDRHKARLAR